MTTNAGASADRLRLAFELHEFAERAVRQRLRRDNPGITENEVDRRVGEWLSMRPGAEQGDAEGRPGTWPRRR